MLINKYGYKGPFNQIKQGNIKQTSDVDALFTHLGQSIDVDPKEIRVSQAARQAYDLGETNDEDPL